MITIVRRTYHQYFLLIQSFFIVFTNPRNKKETFVAIIYSIRYCIYVCNLSYIFHVRYLKCLINLYEYIHYHSQTN